MCGIVGAISEREVPLLLQTGLKRLEYRGYDSAGIAIIDAKGNLDRRRCTGKINNLEKKIDLSFHGYIGIAHTRWATHGKPTEVNAHPIISNNELAVVHNGVIENYATLHAELSNKGYLFESETDTEVIAHLLHEECNKAGNILSGVQNATRLLGGSFALGIIHRRWPDRIIAVRYKSPLVVGIGIGEYFIASDVLALQAFTDQYLFLEDGDIADISISKITVYDNNRNIIKHPIISVARTQMDSDKGNYRHFLQKEIFEQPQSIKATMDGRIGKKRIITKSLGITVDESLNDIQNVKMIACGSSFYSATIACNWIENLVGIQCNVELASEYRYRKVVTPPNCLFVALSQSGETADTIAALQIAKKQGYSSTLSIGNVPVSSMSRLSDCFISMGAGPEISVAATKSMSSQLVTLLLLTITLGRKCNTLKLAQEERIITALHALPDLIEKALHLDKNINTMAKSFASCEHALFLGRGLMYPVALEGALKLKELSYIHAEGYASGELKHGPLAIVDSKMPVLALAPRDDLFEKLQSNLHEVQARDGRLFVFTDCPDSFNHLPNTMVVTMPSIEEILSPILYLIPLQLLAYHAALQKGTDVDQPRNLAKSVTVE